MRYGSTMDPYYSTIGDFEDEFESDGSEFFWDRYLAKEYKAGQPSRIDYSVLSVAVMTLGLIMVVELVRHRLDHAAVGRPFFKAVLEGVYAELATLGIVEFFIWLLKSYYTNMNMPKEKVFAKVHFTLFYTAILNALQSVLVAFATTRVSDKIWVQTETLELNHYVEIREEFERVQAKMDALHHRRGGNTTTKKSDTSSSTASDNAESDMFNTEAGKAYPTPSATAEDEFVLDFSMQGFRGLCRLFVDIVRYPRLKRRYYNLLLQVRFHEMRVHFLQAHNLPLKLKVSDYLVRSEQSVLIKLVHVSTVAWLMLTASINLLYFVLGMVSYEREDPDIAGEALTWIFFGCMGLFVVVAFLVFNKMKSIFKTIVHERELWEVQHDEKEKEVLVSKQLHLFWGADPKWTIVAIQFMQFGYAVALSVVIVFWETIDDGSIAMQWFLIAIFGCYAVFVLITAQVIPRYTLCTSLGQLVDRKRLYETVGLFHLEEAKLHQMEELEYGASTDVDTITRGEDSVQSNAVRRLRDDEGKRQRMEELGEYEITVYNRSNRTRENSQQSLAFDSVHSAGQVSAPGKSLDPNIDSATLMAELVKLDTESLRENLPAPEREALSIREQRKQNRRRRKKTLSDDVSAMARMGRARVKDDSDLRSSKAKMQSVLVSQSSEEDALTPFDTQPDRLLARRSRRIRQKAVSDGVAAMALHSSTTVDHTKDTPTTVEEEKTEEDHELPSDPRAELHEPTGHAERETKADVGDTYLVPLHPMEEGLHKQLSVEPRNAEYMKNMFTAKNDDEASDGGHSDIDDVPEVYGSKLEKPVVPYAPRPSFRARIKAFYLSKRYVVISNVFGTMVAFFFVGQRIERFMHTQGIAPKNEFVSFDFKESFTFWLLTAWLLMFLMSDLVLLFSVGFGRKLKAITERKRVMSAALDFFLASVCLAVFLIAESQRCCYDDGPNVASSSAAEDGSKTSSSYEYDEPAPCNCAAFGSRLYGGLGTIEPYVSLIALRLFRHWFAARIIRRVDSKKSDSAKDKKPELAHQDPNLNPFEVFDEGHGHGGGNGHGHSDGETGTIVELWEAAIGKYPDIVAEYGEFSGELLQAMLGVTPIEGRHSNRMVGKKGQSGRNSSADPNKGGSIVPKKKSFALDKQYSGLAPHAQEVIMQGKLGKAVKAVDFPESGSLRFELDPRALPLPREIESMFTSPNARVVRSMRRCDRKLVPILDKWTVVDVAMTRFEMVYFDATDVDGPGLDKDTEDTRQALAATKGGKGLRLCDLAQGRRIVGHLAFSDINSVHVEREMPDGRIESDVPEQEVKKTEYWQSEKHCVQFSRGHSWSKIKQDRLKIETVHGRTLYLRFYSDLEDAELHPDRLADEDEEEGPLFKNNAFQWVQTIGRYCGPEQLKQPLPHFGDDTAEELRDYLVVHFHHEGDVKGVQRLVRPHSGGLGRQISARHRRFSSMADLRSSPPDEVQHGGMKSEPQIAAGHRRFGSMPELKSSPPEDEGQHGDMKSVPHGDKKSAPQGDTRSVPYGDMKSEPREEGRDSALQFL